jgi:trigger factor
VVVKTAEVRIEEISPVRKKLSFEIPWEEVKKALDRAYETVGKKARVKGFRPGKTPRRILETYFKDQAEGEAITELVNDTYLEALRENSITAVSDPEIHQHGIEANKSFSYEATVEIEPIIDPRGYTELTLEKKAVSVTDQDVDLRLQDLRSMYSSMKDLEEERGVIDGDYVLVDFEGRIGGELRKELTEDNYGLTVGARKLVPGFEEQLAGMKKGDTREFKITFPSDYPTKELAGNEATFRVVIKDIKVRVLPELNEDFIKNFDQYDSLAALREDIRKSTQEQKEAEARSGLRKNLVDKLLEANHFDVPSAYVERQILNMMVDAQKRMVYGGMDPEQAASMAVNLHDRFKDDAARIVKSTLLLQKIAEKESIQVDDKEVEEKLKEIGQKYRQNYETIRQSYEQQNLLESFKLKLLEEKTLDFIESRANIIMEKDA